MAYDVVIRKTDTGEVRRCTMEDLDWFKDDGADDFYWWTEGNFGCDCNRERIFQRAANEEESENPECGETRYVVERVILPNGLEIEIDARR